MPSGTWTLNDSAPFTLGMAFVPVLSWDQLNLVYWGPPMSMVMPTISVPGGLAVHKFLTAGFFGPR